MPKIPSKAKIKKEISPAKKFLSQVNPLDWFVLGLFIAFSLFHILLIFFGRNLLTVVSTFLFQILNLVLAVYFAVRITTKSVIDKVTEKQKGIAKTAIRQNIISQSINNNIIKIVKEKIECFKNTKMKDALNDINNHLEILSQSIGSSEFAFKDILDEELREEHQTWSKIRGLENLVKEKIIQQSEIDKKKVEAKVKVPADQLSLAIGKGGQNVRLAAKLTGWKVDIEGSGDNIKEKKEEAKEEKDENVKENKEIKEGETIELEKTKSESIKENDKDTKEKSEDIKKGK